MICLCFDFGTTSWGVAVGDQISGSVEPLKAVAAHRGVPDWAIIDGYLLEWKPDQFVMGYPLKALGERFKLTDWVDQAILAIKVRYPDYLIETADERLSTVLAKEALYRREGKKGLSKGKIDSESAKIILEDWFELQSFL